jgi:hypothetical protein
MPQALIPIIIAAAGAATSIGTSIYGAVNAPGDHSAELAKQQADAQAAADAKAKADELASKQNAAKSALLHNSPDIQAQLGGSVSPDYYAQVVGTSTGQADQIDFMKRLQGIFGGQGGGGGTGFFGGIDPSQFSGGSQLSGGFQPQPQDDIFKSSGSGTGLVG